ncbi:c-type cytochrome [Mucilaginibacter segetis]|uniref:Cytochrome c n=1 Tax=Mucilaginibacter segetis TaxID=2793071 RepID=A0A934UPN9_9SPHI|nr:c-type cytochrome [Mucilaginibacter segetis]MBK0381157.1 cytochrome c [Mucilaginibacter segetis]
MKLKIITLSLILLTMIVSCQSQDQLEFKRYYTSGSLIYQQRCQNCHGKNGEGLSALIPPLTDSVFLAANKQKLACFVKYGLNTEVVINGKKFEDQMPATDLTPVELAEVLTYVTNSFGNKMGTISAEQVNAHLQQCR